MKKSFFVALSLGLMIVSCNRDNDDHIVATPVEIPQAKQNPLVGKWEQVKKIIHTQNDLEEIPTECEKKSTWEFTNNLDVVRPVYAFNQDTQQCDLLPTPDNGTQKYEYNETDKIIKIGTLTYEIVSVSDTELRLKAEGSTTIYRKL